MDDADKSLFRYREARICLVPKENCQKLHRLNFTLPAFVNRRSSKTPRTDKYHELPEINELQNVFKAKVKASSGEKIIAGARREMCVLKNMAKNKSPTFHNLSWEQREKIVYFPLKKPRGKVLLLTQLTPTTMSAKGRGGGTGE